MKRILSFFLLFCMAASLLLTPVSAAGVPQAITPDYKVSFYAFDCFNMQDENGRRSGYGYEMMENIAKYMQCTFSYLGYNNSAEECVQMLREGKLDLYTAAKRTPEREAEFVFSTHPAITATTCMNVKVGNTKVVAGEVDALVNSYIRTPEDEATVESFGETPYYLMARKEDQDLINKIDAAIDQMNVESPNWRADLYNQYYGTQASNIDFTDEEQDLLDQLQQNKAVLRAVFDPDAAPYSYFDEKGGGCRHRRGAVQGNGGGAGPAL